MRSRQATIHAQASHSSHVLGDPLTTPIRRRGASGGRGESGGIDQRPVLLVVEAGTAIETLLEGQTTSFQIVSADNRHSAINRMRRHDPIVIAVDLDRGDAGPPSREESANGDSADGESSLEESADEESADAESADEGSSDEGSLDEESTDAGSTDARSADEELAEEATGERAGGTIETPTVAGQAEAFRTMQDLMALSPTTRFIALVAASDHEAAVRAVSMGVHDVFEKPLDADAFRLVVERTFSIADIEHECLRRLEAASRSGIDGIVTRAPQMLRLCQQVLDLAQTRETVLFEGEPGTGKHLLAQALHLHSPRSDHRFAVVRCTVRDHRRLLTELFGSERPAPSGDDKNDAGTTRCASHPGKLELAHGGTLFLDEVSELPEELQVHLLAFLRDRSIQRNGTNQTVEVDVRVVCSSRFDLSDLAARGRFHPGLALALSATRLRVPPLRERAGDAALLAHTILRRLGRRHGRNRLTLSEAALDAIGVYPFPGNVRELENAMRKAIVNVIGRIITPADLELPHAPTPDILNLRRIRDDAERQAVLRVMARSDGNVARAAELLGISRPTLYDLLNRFGLR
ncbi:MAG: sigma 54-interacting transcriptional regulator [Burkholderiaceae bacterium]